MSNLVKQKRICEKWGADFLLAEPTQKLGIAQNVESGMLPINGLRHPPSDDTSGWYIWAGGEPDDSEDFFSPLHVCHITDYFPTVEKYLGLAPGWRFLIAPDHEDVWFDSSLLTALG